MERCGGKYRPQPIHITLGNLSLHDFIWDFLFPAVIIIKLIVIFLAWLFRPNGVAFLIDEERESRTGKRRRK